LIAKDAVRVAATMDRDDNRPVGFLHSPDAVEDVASSRRVLLGAFLKAPQRTAQREEVILSPEMREPPVLLVRRGTAYSSVMLTNGRRAIFDIFLTGDFIGVEQAVTARASLELKAADVVTYNFFNPTKLRELMAN
jgi:hypothetical protein